MNTQEYYTTRSLYKELLRLAKVPEFLIEHPELIYSSKLSEDDMRNCNEWIEKYEAKKKEEQDKYPF